MATEATGDAPRRQVARGIARIGIRTAPGAGAVRLALAVLACAGLLAPQSAWGRAGAGPVAAQAASVPEPDHGLMIQVSTLSSAASPAQLRTWLEAIRAQNADPSAPHTPSVVLQDIGDASGNLLTSYLDVIAPFLPGGATPAFTRAYVGTVDLSTLWPDPATLCSAGIESASFRAQNITESTSLAAAFVQRYPNVTFDWYITYEADISGFWDPATVSAYAHYVYGQLMPALDQISPGHRYLWSPALWTPLATVQSRHGWALDAGLTWFFALGQRRLVLDVQDTVAPGNETPAQAITWAQYLSSLAGGYLAGPVALDAEQFRYDASGNLIAGTQAQIAGAEDYYVQHGIPLGPAWEIRYWYQRMRSTGQLP